MRIAKTFFYVTMAAMAVSTVTTSCKSSSSEGDTAAVDSVETNIPKVEVQLVAEEMVPQLGTYTATVEAFKTNNIASSTPNRIKSILVDVGSKVSAGQKVVVLDDVNIDQLKVKLDNAKLELDRAKQLLEIGAGTQQSVDNLKASVDAQKRAYTNAVENTVLTSPITGVVTTRNYDPGDMTGALPILVIEQVRPVKVIVNVSESEFTKVKKGMTVKVNLDTYGDEDFTGTVSLIHPTIDEKTRTFTVEITIPNANEKILPGMFARVTMNFGTQSHVVVPDRAVVKQTGSGNRYVYVYNPATKTVSYNKVELGQRISDKYELLSGVDAGSLVVVSGQSKLANGTRVDAIDKSSK